MNIDEKTKLYARYGELMIQMEILQNQLGEVKRQIIEQLNRENQTSQDHKP